MEALNETMATLQFLPSPDELQELQDSILNWELSRIETPKLQELQAEAGVHVLEKAIVDMTEDEKVTAITPRCQFTC